jgi:hypothetical protein
VNVVNRSPGKHLPVPMKDRDGRDRLVVIVKYTYRAGRGGLERDDDGAAPRPIDEPNGDDPATSSIERPSDLCDFKPGTDVVLIGHAYPRTAGATHADVSLRVGSIAKTVRAHGLRAWQRGVFGGVKPGPARPIRAPVPLIYELAWGGLDTSLPDKPLGEPRNYVGRGVARDAARLVDQPAAQLESLERPLGERDNVPASFGAVHRHWQPRVRYVGTYDDAWKQTRMPLLPRDFDPRFYVCTPADQWSPAPLAGNESVEVIGATEDASWRFRLPGEAPTFTSVADQARHAHPTHLDTILIDADDRTVELVWRASIPIPKKLEQLDEVRVTHGADRA